VIGISKLYCGAATSGDALRYESKGPRGTHPRPIVVWNVTSRCQLKCVHCYSRSEDRAAADELSTDEALAVLEDLGRFGVPVVLFSGGEPLLRPDLWRLIDRAVGLGMRTVLSTNGTRIDERTAARLRESGVGYVGVSLDGLRAVNDRFRGVEGAFDRALEGLRQCRKAGVKTGLRFTITRRNADQIDGLFRLARDEDIPRLCFYHLVYAGRASALIDEDLDHAATRRLVDQIVDRTADLHAQGRPVDVLTVDNHADGPYLVLRMEREGHPRAAEALRLLKLNGGNASGSRLACIGWDGAVHPDQFWRHATLGNVRERPFSEIWTDPANPLLAQLRDKRRHVEGRCAACRFLDLCGGNLRVRAEAVTGNPWASDPACYLTDEEIGVAASET